jgi:predicted dithiol-disulfide oxidoreductase (DUF899 family)
METAMSTGLKLKGVQHDTMGHNMRFPNEDDATRQARLALLRAEIALRRQTEAVAAQRRALPKGPPIKEDYILNRGSGYELRFSDLFDGKRSLVTYSMMFGPQRERPCPSCSALLDGLDGAVRHIEQRTSFVVLARSPIARIRDAAHERGWTQLRFASTFGTTFNKDYFAEDDDGFEWPATHVWTRDGDTVRHFYAAEMLFTEPDEGQDFRHNGALDLLWNVFDLTPEGRDPRMQLKLEY